MSDVDDLSNRMSVCQMTKQFEKSLAEVTAKKADDASHEESGEVDKIATDATDNSDAQTSPRHREGSFQTNNRSGLVSPPFRSNFEISADKEVAQKLEAQAEVFTTLIREQFVDRPGYYAPRSQGSRRLTRSTSMSSNGGYRAPRPFKHDAAVVMALPQQQQHLRQRDRPGFFVARTAKPQAQQGNYIEAPMTNERQRRNRPRRGDSNNSKPKAKAITIPLRVVG